MAQAELLDDAVPESCENHLTHSANEFRSKIPELARDKDRLSDVEATVQPHHSNHEAHERNARDLSVFQEEGVQLAVTSPQYFNPKYYKNGVRDEDQLGELIGYWSLQVPRTDA